MTRWTVRLRTILGAALAFAVLPVVGIGMVVSAGAATACGAVRGGVRFAAPGSGKTVALTFDDGPGRDTRRILAVLAANHVPATFFNLGVNEANDPAAVRAENAVPYALGDHTWDHQSLPTLSAAGQASEMDRERAEQASITGRYPCLFRPPYGSYDATTLALAQQRNMAVWYWSVDTEDWKADGSGAQYWVDRITSRADAGISQAHPVILMHNQPIGNPATVAALQRIINFYRAHGYRFVDLLGRGAAPTVRSVSPNSGATVGHTRVAVTGTGFVGVHKVMFGTAAGSSVHVVSSTRLYVTTPRHSAGLAGVHVVGSFGTSANTSADHYSYVRPPTVTAVSPRTGTTLGGSRVVVTGTDFRHVSAVKFGTTNGTALHVVAPTRLYITAPAHAAGLVGVHVLTRYGTSNQATDHYTYVAPPAVTSIAPAEGSVDGGTVVTITGARFSAGNVVTFGGIAGSAVVVSSSTSLTVISPPHAAGPVAVRVSTVYGSSPLVSADLFTYS